MKLSHIALASSICMIAAFSGCGGSGTPLPAPTKVAKVTFIAQSTATGGLRINDYSIDGFNIPAKFSLPIYGTPNREREILASNYYSLKTSAYALGSYSTSTITVNQPGKSFLSLLPVSSPDPNAVLPNIGFKNIAALELLMSDQTMDKSTVTSLLTVANPAMQAIAGLCPQTGPCPTATPLPVFYNISVSIQTR